MRAIVNLEIAQKYLEFWSNFEAALVQCLVLSLVSSTTINSGLQTGERTYTQEQVTTSIPVGLHQQNSALPPPPPLLRYWNNF